jgi:hypothetical protein
VGVTIWTKAVGSSGAAGSWAGSPPAGSGQLTPQSSGGRGLGTGLIKRHDHRPCDANPPVPPFQRLDGRAIIRLYPATPSKRRTDGRTLSEALGAPTSCGPGHVCPGQSHLSPLRNIPVRYHRTPAWSYSHDGAGDHTGVHRRTSYHLRPDVLGRVTIRTRYGRDEEGQRSHPVHQAGDGEP